MLSFTFRSVHGSAAGFLPGKKYANTQGAAAQSFVMGALFSFLWFGKTKFPKAEVRVIALHSSPCLHSGRCKAARLKKKKMHLDERACKLWVECPLPVSWFYIKQKQDCLESRKVWRTVVRTLAIFYFMHIFPRQLHLCHQILCHNPWSQQVFWNESANAF